jgi:hypothetical protein
MPIDRTAQPRLRIDDPPVGDDQVKAALGRRRDSQQRGDGGDERDREH